MIKDEFKIFFKDQELDKVEIRNGIPRFSPDFTYSTGNFSKLRENHAKLQLDSLNNTNDRRNTLFINTNWEPSFFKNKTILECGCGVGPDTEILLSLGAKVIAVDIAGIDIAKANLKEHPNLQLVQADISNMPFIKKSFDIVYCHRVLQHTPYPTITLEHILGFVKDEGAVFVHSYAYTLAQFLTWKYPLRIFTKRMSSEKLYDGIKLLSGPLYHITNFTNRLGKFGKYLNHVLIPFTNYGNSPYFKGKSKEFIIEYGIHDTFDALSPRYDNPVKAKIMKELATKMLKKPFIIKEEPRSTYLVSKIV
jgi:SAM-dependent methyltransferase